MLPDYTGMRISDLTVERDARGMTTMIVRAQQDAPAPNARRPKRKAAAAASLSAELRAAPPRRPLPARDWTLPETPPPNMLSERLPACAAWFGSAFPLEHNLSSAGSEARAVSAEDEARLAAVDAEAVAAGALGASDASPPAAAAAPGEPAAEGRDPGDAEQLRALVREGQGLRTQLQALHRARALRIAQENRRAIGLDVAALREHHAASGPAPRPEPDESAFPRTAGRVMEITPASVETE